MNRRTALKLLAGGSAVGALTLGTKGFSQSSARRNVEITVTNDKKAYLRLVLPSGRQDVGTSGHVSLTVGNQTVAALDQLTIELDASGDGKITDVSVDSMKFKSNNTGPVELKPMEEFVSGSEVHVTVEVGDFSESGHGKLLVDITAVGSSDDIKITTERSIEIKGDSHDANDNDNSTTTTTTASDEPS